MITHTFETLPVVTFFKIMETQDLTLLLKERSNYLWINKLKIKLFKANLSDVYKEISKTYAKGQDVSKYNHISDLKQKLVKLTADYQTILMCLDFLQGGEDKDVENILINKGYSFNGSYKENLLKIYKQSENLKNKIDNVKKEIESYMKVDDSIKNNDTTIYDAISNVLVGLGLSLKANEITCAEFISLRKRLGEKIDAQNKQQQNNGK